MAHGWARFGVGLFTLFSWFGLRSARVCEVGHKEVIMLELIRCRWMVWCW